MSSRRTPSLPDAMVADRTQSRSEREARFDRMLGAAQAPRNSRGSCGSCPPGRRSYPAPPPPEKGDATRGLVLPCGRLELVQEFQLTKIREWAHVVRQGAEPLAIISGTVGASPGPGSEIWVAPMPMADPATATPPTDSDWVRIGTTTDISDIWHVYSNGFHWISWADDSGHPRTLRVIRFQYDTQTGTFSQPTEFYVITYGQNSYSTVNLGHATPDDGQDQGWERVYRATNDHFALVDGASGGPSYGMGTAFPTGAGFAFMHLKGDGSYGGWSHVGDQVQAQPGSSGTPFQFGGAGGSGVSVEVLGQKFWHLFGSQTLNTTADEAPLVHVVVGPALEADAIVDGRVRTQDVGLTTPEADIAFHREAGFVLAMPTAILLTDCWLVTYRKSPGGQQAGNDDGEIWRAWFDGGFQLMQGPVRVASGGCNRPHAIGWTDWVWGPHPTLGHYIRYYRDWVITVFRNPSKWQTMRIERAVQR